MANLLIVKIPLKKLNVWPVKVPQLPVISESLLDSISPPESPICKSQVSFFDLDSMRLGEGFFPEDVMTHL